MAHRPSVKNFLLVTLAITYVSLLLTVNALGREETINAPVTGDLTVPVYKTVVMTVTETRCSSPSSHFTASNPTTEEHSTNNLRALAVPFIFVYNVIYWIISWILYVIYLVLTPVIAIVKFFYYILIYAPYTFFQRIFYTFSPLYTFCGFAAMLGFAVGGTAGWFSEVIVGVLTTPAATSNELFATEQESKKNVAKMRRRPANLRARNGGRIPEEFYQRLNTSQQGLVPEEFYQRLNASQQGLVARNGGGTLSDGGGYTPSRFSSLRQRPYAGSAYGGD